MAYPDYREQSDKPVTVRYNNPGGMWPGPSSRKFGELGSVDLNDGLDQGNKSAVFPTAVHGAAALFDLFHRVYAGQSLAEAIDRWSGGNNVISYLDMFDIHAGIGPGDVITKAQMRDPKFAIRFAKTMARHETGYVYPLSMSEWRAAHSMAFPGVEVPPVKEMPKKAPVSTTVGLSGLLLWISGLAEQALDVLMAAAGKFGELGPVKGMFAEAGANTNAFLVGGVILVLAYAGKKILTPKAEES